VIWSNCVFNERSEFEGKIKQRKNERTVESKGRKIKKRAGLKEINKLKRERYRN
jgi:hypothetical protein